MIELRAITFILRMVLDLSFHRRKIIDFFSLLNHMIFSQMINPIKAHNFHQYHELNQTIELLILWLIFNNAAPFKTNHFQILIHNQ